MENQPIEEQISAKLIFVLLISLFTIIVWGGIQIMDVSSKESNIVEYKKYLTPMGKTYDQTILDEFSTRKAKYQIISREKFNGTVKK